MKEDIPYPRFWRVCRLISQAFYWLKRGLYKYANFRPIAVLGPPVCAAYLTILDVWGDKWDWIKSNEDLHTKCFWGVVAVPLVALLLRGIFGEPERLDSPDVAHAVLADYIQAIGVVVEAKTNRFRDSIANLKPNSDKFKHITHPEIQVKIITESLARFIESTFDIKNDQLDITILKKRPTGSWHFFHRHQSAWKHADPQKIMESPSAAAACLIHCEPEFFADKIIAAREKKFFLSRRDKQHGTGSVFLYPIEIDTNQGTYQAVISIVTYKKQLCQEHEKESKAITKSLLGDFCRRYRLELYLDAIRHDC